MFEIGDICYYRLWPASSAKYVLIVGKTKNFHEVIMFENNTRFYVMKSCLLPLDYFDKPFMYEMNEVF